MTLLVSIHDVAPPFEAAVRTLWALCAERGVRPALLVVPEWHGEWPLEAHPALVEWIRARAAEGAEIVLHGVRHDEVGSPRGAGHHLRAWGRTDREGEFLTLDGAAARERIERGLRRLRALGVEPSGFIPPAWLATEAGFAAVGAAGLHYSEDDGAVRLFPEGHRIASPVVRWSARTAVRAWGSAAVAEARWRVQRSAALVRIALHPPDVGRAVTRRSVVRTLDRWLAVRRPIRYADLRAG